ncbi:response regulator [Ferruginibacter lapsinanis]|uniref:PAS domain-containing hybrid sensor histidine kinase/response regulator n=1 Tax=Ferruginibacter lapsinanis TaxID=563172 RepID=UPI001E3CF80E|nr:ATP-binding protein [Ferruginibacter lapsinanis]UEG50880.1 response regulator [Ferruginibacter lapsinanis]
MAKKIISDRDELTQLRKELVLRKVETNKLVKELVTARKELLFQNKEKGKRATELGIANKELEFQGGEKEKRAAELGIANKELIFQTGEKKKRAAELVIADKELEFQTQEKKKRAAELGIANLELIFQTGEKKKRAAELLIADKELDFQNKEKKKREIKNKKLEATSNSAIMTSQYSRSLIEASLDPLVTINSKGLITDINEAMIKATGKPRKNIIGTYFADYFVETKKVKEVYEQVFGDGYVMNYPLTIIDGVLTDVLLSGSVYKDDHGKVIGAVLVARDITDLKKVEKELIEARVFAELATLIAEEAKLKAESSTLKAEDAVKAKQQFLSNMSHEIRTPMNAIIGFTKVMLKTELSAKQKEYLMAIKMSGDALIVLINDILDLAKVDAGKMVFEQVPFKLSLSISAMLHLFETKIQEKNLELVKIYDENIPEVLIGDPVRLHQIILNLVSNAVKFTPAGNITVGVKLLSEDAEKVTIGFSVSDTGIGIVESKIETIFENFQQASSGTSRIFGGTGLGLAIVKQLVEPQGGNIDVKSEVDKGSTFSFTLSFLKTKENIIPDNDILEIDTEIKNISVLVVEDIALNQLLMKTLLDDFGFERDIASNGKMAIEKLKDKSYDVILMDLQMPEMNGFEATEYIRKTLKSAVPIIALTADVTTVDLAKCKAVGMNDYIAKPVDERLLYSKIVGLVKKNTSMVPEKDKDNTQAEKEKCIDLSYLNLRTKSNPSLMMEMILLYLEQTPPLIKTIKQSFLDKDWSMLHSAVHKMIPSFSIMGIGENFENIAKKIQEYAGIQSGIDEMETMVSQLEDVCGRACVELEHEFNRIKNQTNGK